MCVKVIIDTSVSSKFVCKDSSFNQIRHWIVKERKGTIIYCISPEISPELSKLPKEFRNFLESARKSLVANLLSQDQITDHLEHIHTLATKSKAKDSYILAMARQSGATVLCTCDGNLMADFKNSNILPKVGNESRSIYPKKERSAAQRKFLASRRCPG